MSMSSVLLHALVAGLTALVAVGITVGIMFAALPICYEESPAETSPYRPLYHYTPKFGWVNDPNGLIYYKGEWHLYYQHDFETILHGNMSWGHAVSTDLVHWHEQSLAISYDTKEQIFSGSVVADTDCVSGLCSEPDQPVLIAFYTSYNQEPPHIQSQHIASSTTLGRTWTKYGRNPVLDINNEEFRDPKVQKWNENWLMLVQRSKDHVLEFYQSQNLTSWQKVGEYQSFDDTQDQVGSVWECPDIFKLHVDDDPAKAKWVLIVNINPGQRIAGSAGQFWIGEFDGQTFTKDNNTTWLDWGMDNYATITWDSAPDNQRVSIGWMSNWVYTEQAPTGPDFRNAFTSPRTLKLRTIGGKVRLTQMPVAQMATLRLGDVPYRWGDKKDLKDGEIQDLGHGIALDIEAVFTNKGAKEFGIKVFAGTDQETLVGYDATEKVVFVDRTISGNVKFHDKFPGRHSAPFDLEAGEVLRVRILVDKASVEAFFGEGEIAITDVVFPDLTKDGISMYTKGGSVHIDTYNVWQMGSYQKEV